MRHEILEIEGYGSEIYYFEGNSGKLAATDEGPSSWFCFEETFANGCLELTRLGFTATQIMEAQGR